MFDQLYPINKKIDFDGSYGYQCFDLANYWHLKNTNLQPKIELLRACDIFYNPNGFFNDSVRFKKIENRPDNFPKANSLIVWSENIGQGYGHVAIVESANVNNFVVREQDGFNQVGIKKTTYQNYRNVLGWFELETSQKISISKEVKNQRPTKTFEDPYYQNLWNDNNIDLALSDLLDRDKEIENLKKEIESKDKQIESLTTEIRQVFNQNQQIQTKQAETFDFNKFFVSFSKNSVLQSFLAGLITLLISYICSSVPELESQKDLITTSLLSLIGLGAIGQNSVNAIKTFKK